MLPALTYTSFHPSDLVFFLTGGTLGKSMRSNVDGMETIFKICSILYPLFPSFKSLPRRQYVN